MRAFIIILGTGLLTLTQGECGTNLLFTIKPYPFPANAQVVSTSNSPPTAAADPDLNSEYSAYVIQPTFPPKIAGELNMNSKTGRPEITQRVPATIMTNTDWTVKPLNLKALTTLVPAASNQVTKPKLKMTN